MPSQLGTMASPMIEMFLIVRNRSKTNPDALRSRDALDQLDDPDLSVRIGLDVPLSGSKVSVSGQHLDIPQ